MTSRTTKRCFTVNQGYRELPGIPIWEFPGIADPQNSRREFPGISEILAGITRIYRSFVFKIFFNCWLWM